MMAKSGASKQDLAKIKKMVEDGKGVEAIATTLGIHKEAVGNWVKHFKDGGLINGTNPTKAATKAAAKVAKPTASE